MKILIIKSVFVIALMLLITPLNAQSLKPLSKDKRDSTLISIAKKVLQKEAPEYLLEYGKPIISERKIRRMTQEEEKAVPDFSPLHGAKSERIYYIVEFPQNESIKRFEEGFVAQVYVWADNSHPFTLVLGNGLIQRLK